MITRKRIAFGIGATALALGVAGAGYQIISAQEPGSAGPRAQFQQGGPGGGPGGPAGPMGRRGGPGMGPGGRGMLGSLPLGRLDLTEDQRNRVQQIMESHRDEQRAVVERARKAHDALRAVTESATFDESAVRARAADVAGVEADMAVARARIYSEVYQILTADQQATLKTFQERREQRQDQLRDRQQQRQERRQR